MQQQPKLTEQGIAHSTIQGTQSIFPPNFFSLFIGTAAITNSDFINSAVMLGNFNYKEAGIWDYTHFRWYTFATGKKLLEQHNFTIESATVTGDIPAKSIFGKLLPEFLMKKIYTGLIGLSKGFFGYQLLYKACKQKV